MKSNEIKLSPYKLIWVEFIPNKGFVTMHDQRAFEASFPTPRLKTYRKPFGNKAAALSFIKQFSKSWINLIRACCLPINSTEWRKNLRATKSLIQRNSWKTNIILMPNEHFNRAGAKYILLLLLLEILIFKIIQLWLDK